MKPLEPPDKLHVQAAQGWCELHAFAEADAELDNITASLRAHPKVLEVGWLIYANLEKWAGALEIANAIVRLMPDWTDGWIYRANSLSELNRQQEAYEMLGATASLFPADEIILCDLPCVCCALNGFDEARTWLGNAIDADGNETKLRALDDPDLEDWKEFGRT